MYFDSISTLSLYISNQREAIQLFKTIDKGTAQGRRVTSNCPHSGFRSKELILEVGSAYLSKKLRGKTEKEVISRQRLQYVTTSNKAKGPRLEPKLCLTKGVHKSNSSYKLNSSQKRSKLHANSVKALQDCLKDIKPVKGLKDNQVEIKGLRYALVFEMLRTTLLIWLVIVQIGTAKARYVKKQLDRKVIREQDKDYNKGIKFIDITTSFTNNIINFTGFTDSKELVQTLQASVKDPISVINSQKHFIDYSADLLYTTFLHLSINILLITLSTITTLSSSNS